MADTGCRRILWRLKRGQEARRFLAELRLLFRPASLYGAGPRVGELPWNVMGRDGDFLFLDVLGFPKDLGPAEEPLLERVQFTRERFLPVQGAIADDESPDGFLDELGHRAEKEHQGVKAG